MMAAEEMREMGASTEQISDFLESVAAEMRGDDDSWY